MSEAPEPTPAEQIDAIVAAQDTPEVEAPEAPPTEDTPPQHDYEKRYNDLRSEFDRRNEELKVLEQLRSDDPAVYSHALKELGFGGDEPEDEPAPTYDDPLDEVRAELAALKKERDDERAAIETEIRRQQELEHVQRQLAEVDPDKSLTQEEVNLLVAAAAQQRGEDGLPNVKAVYDLYEKGVARRVPKYAASKRAPHVPSGGVSANPTNPDLDSASGRADLIDEVMRDWEYG